MTTPLFSAESLIKSLKEKYENRIGFNYTLDKRVILEIEKEMLLNVMDYLRGEQGFDCLASVSGIDDPESNSIELSYQLQSTGKKAIILLKTRLDRKTPAIDSVIHLFPSGDWHEKEIYEMLGVNFEGREGLGRFLLPEDWRGGHPFRRDFSF